MQDIHCKLSRVAAVVMTLLAIGVGNVWGQGFQGGMPWQVGDIAICFGSGTCNMVRIVSGSPVVLDQFSDSGSVSVAGNTFTTSINNNLHLFVGDAGTGGSSNVVEYTIASVNPFSGFPVAHTVLHVFDGSTGTGSENIQALALDYLGDMFVGNASPATIVELNQSGSAALGSYPLSTVVSTPAWQASHLYNSIGTTILDPNGHVQKVASAGTSGALYPPFNQFDGIALDNAVVWTDKGQKQWTSKTSYALNAVIIDPANHLQQVTAAGTSGNKQPTWNDSGSTTKDASVTWMDRGSIAWQPTHPYSLPRNPPPIPLWDPSALAAGTNFHLEQVSTAGTSGPSAPTWTSTTFDGLTWADQGSPVGQSCIANQIASLDLSTGADAVYFSSGPGGIIEKVSTPLSASSSCIVFADFGPNVTLHGIKVVPPNSMPSTCVSNSCPNTNGGILVVATGTQFVDTDGDLPGVNGFGTGDATEFSSGLEVQDVCTGSVLPAAPAPPGPSAPDSCALLLDAGTGNLVARYPISSVTTLQALALDPMVTDCTGTNCSAAPPPPPFAQVNNLWLGDFNSANFYEVNLGTGSSSGPFNANANISQVCPACPQFNSIEGLGIYVGKDANQTANAPITKLFIGSLTSSSPGNTANVNFPLPFSANDTNNLTVTGYNLPGTTSLNLYASLIAASTGANDQGIACRATTSNPNKCIVWKVDAGLPAFSTAVLTEKFAAPTTLLPPLGIDSSTDVFVDEAFDTTTSVGNFDPMGLKTSVHSLHEILGPNNGEVNAGCSYGGNLSNRCFQNPNNITFKFTCTSFPGSSLQNYAGGNPDLVIVQDPFPLPSPPPAYQPICQNTSSGVPPDQFCQLSGTGGTTNWRFDPTSNQFVFNWNVLGQGTYRACTFDPTQKNTPFCVNFSVATTASCP
jgi:hypothetical protein